MKTAPVMLTLALFLLTSICCNPAAEQVDTLSKKVQPKEKEFLRFAIPPTDSPYHIFKRYNELAKYASTALEQKVKIVIPKTDDELTTRFNSGDFAFALVDPSLLALISDSATLVVSTTTEQDEVRRGIIVISSESPIQNLEELKEKSICIVGRSGPETYTSQMATLRANGVFSSDLRFIIPDPPSEMSAIDSLLAAECEAAFVSESHMRTLDDDTLSKLKVLAYTARIPSGAVVVAHKNTPQESIDKFREALLKLDKGSKPLRSTGFDGFAEADQELYTKFLNAYNAE